MLIIVGTLLSFAIGSVLMDLHGKFKLFLGGNINITVVWTAACPMSDLFGKGQINQMSDSDRPNDSLSFDVLHRECTLV